MAEAKTGKDRPAAAALLEADRQGKLRLGIVASILAKFYGRTTRPDNKTPIVTFTSSFSSDPSERTGRTL